MALDTDILLWINSHHAEWADMLMWACSGRLAWIPLYVLMLAAVACEAGLFGPGVRELKSWRRFGLAVLAFALVVVLCDQSSHVLKGLIARPRPSHNPELEGMLHLVRDYTGGMYGHPSSHAANTMGIALLFTLWMRPFGASKKYANATTAVVMALFVGLNCYSRMYLGVHYPGDILFGLVIGSLWGAAVWAALRALVGDGRQSGGWRSARTGRE